MLAELAQTRALPKHTAVVRITHWINSFSFLALLSSGFAILLAHPRLYWGETGAFGSPALIELPLPLNLDQSGWGRSLHFLGAWICVLNGLVYVLSGLISHHFVTNMMPDRDEIAFGPMLHRVSDALHWRRSESESAKYNVMQRITYLSVVFVFFPLIILTGLAMSPAVTSLVPIIVRIFGGYQSSRTIHFFVTNLLVGFVIIHLAMVSLAGFWIRTRPMILGNSARAKESL